MPLALVLLNLLACGTSHEAPAPPETPPVETPPVATPPVATPTNEADPAGPETWSLAGTSAPAKSEGSLRLSAVRTGSHEGFDRIVLEFNGDQVPAYSVAYIDRPARDCTAGADLEVEGAGLLQIQLQSVAAHDDAGASTTPKETKPALPVVREIERSCDFEGVVAYVVGVASPNPYRAFELSAPPRLVVDVKR